MWRSSPAPPEAPASTWASSNAPTASGPRTPTTPSTASTSNAGRDCCSRPELVGSHIGPATAHLTGRTTRLAFRCATALFGHTGIEWDLTSCTEQDLDELATFIGLYKRHRGLIHSGTTVRADHPDPAALLHGVVATDRSRALYCYAQRGTSVASAPVRLRLPGLDHATRYRVTLPPELTPHARIQGPLATAGITATGRVLATAGFSVPRPVPGDALLLEVER